MVFFDCWESESDSESDSAPNVSISSKTEYSSPYKGISNDIIKTLFGNIGLPVASYSESMSSSSRFA